MGAFEGLYGGGSPSFNFSSPSPLEGTGQPVPSNLPSWAQTGLGLFGGIAGTAINALNTYNQLRDKNGRLSDDYEADRAAREREGYNVPRQVGIPTWLIVVGVVAVGVFAYKLAD